MTPQPVARALVARTMTAATAVMCRVRACPATPGLLV